MALEIATHRTYTRKMPPKNRFPGRRTQVSPRASRGTKASNGLRLRAFLTARHKSKLPGCEGWKEFESGSPLPRCCCGRGRRPHGVSPARRPISPLAQAAIDLARAQRRTASCSPCSTAHPILRALGTSVRGAKSREDPWTKLFGFDSGSLLLKVNGVPAQPQASNGKIIFAHAHDLVRVCVPLFVVRCSMYGWGIHTPHTQIPKLTDFAQNWLNSQRNRPSSPKNDEFGKQMPN